MVQFTERRSPAGFQVPEFDRTRYAPLRYLHPNLRSFSARCAAVNSGVAEAAVTAAARVASLLRHHGAIRFSEHILANGPDVFAHACRLGAEAIVSKRLGSPYRSGPCWTWIKVRNPASIAV